MTREEIELQVEKFFNWSERKYKNVVTFQQQVNFSEHIARKSVPQWQPIETAPRDGTSIIVCSSSGNVWCDVSWVKRPRAGDRWEHLTLGALRFNHAYWMPIPKPPGETK